MSKYSKDVKIVYNNLYILVKMMKIDSETN